MSTSLARGARFVSLRSIVFLVLMGFLALALSGQDTGLNRTVRVEGQAAHVASPGSVLSLAVRVTETGGAAAAGVDVVFFAPAVGPSGTFSGAAPGVPAQRVTTNGDGVATVTFTTGSVQGAFLVGALAAETGSAATIAVSNWGEIPGTGAAAADVRTIVAQELLQAPEENDAFRLHGPFLLPAGYTVIPGGDSNPSANRLPRVLEKPTWLLWADLSPIARFHHDTRFVLVDAAATAAEVADAALTSAEEWWPDVVRPDPDTTSFRLLTPLDSYYYIAPEQSTPQAIAAALAGKHPETTARRSAWGGGAFARYVGVPPENACAIIIHGPDSPGSPVDGPRFREYLLENNLVEFANIFRTAPLVSVTDRWRRSASREDLQRLIDQAAFRGCQKLYFYYSGHGSSAENGKGLVLADANPENPPKYLRYEDLAQMLAPFKNAELCVVIDACYSGQFMAWFNGLGYHGTVITAASDSRTAFGIPLPFTGGGYVTNGLLEAFRTPAADSDSSGDVSFVEAFNYAKANATGTRQTVFERADPQVAPIAPTGVRMAPANNYYKRKPGPITINVERPKSVPPTDFYTVTVKPDDATALTVSVSSRTVVLAPGVTTLPVPSYAEETGIHGYSVIGQDSSGNQYMGHANVQVGSFYVKDWIRIEVGETRDLVIDRFGYFQRKGGAGMFILRSADPAIAVPITTGTTPGEQPFPEGASSLSIAIMGKTPGRTTVRLTDSVSRSVGEIEVVVVAAPPPPATACPVSATVPVQFTVTADPSGHKPFVGLVSANVNWQRSGGSFTITSDALQVPRIEGIVNPGTCAFSGTAIAPGPIAGFSNVQADVTNGTFVSAPQENLKFKQEARFASTTTMQFAYRLGANGVFPGGQPISYTATGPVNTAGCDLVLATNPLSVDYRGGNQSIGLTTGTGCPWQAESTVEWIRPLLSANGSGPVELAFEVLPNLGEARSGTLDLGTATLTVNQAAAGDTEPLITAVVNGASFEAGGSTGSWMSIFGSNLATSTRNWGDGDFPNGNLPTVLDGVSVKINGTSAYPSYISPGQLNVLLPEGFDSDAKAMLTVTNAQGTSNSFPIFVFPTAPELFRFDPANRKYAAAVHADSTLVGKIGIIPSTTTRPLRSGDVFLLYGTGFGVTDPPTPVGKLITTPAILARKIVVRIGGRDAEVQYAGKVLAGLFQFNIKLPILEDGDHEIEIWIDGIRIREGAYLTVEN